MSNRLLKQEEIDALLNDQAIDPAQPDAGAELPLDLQAEEEAAGARSMAGEQVVEQTEENTVLLKDEEKDALGEIGNISMGAAATTLSMLLNHKVSITSPEVNIATLQELFAGFDIPHMSICVRFIEGLDGYNLLILKLRDAAIMANLMMGGDGTNVSEELDELGISAASEAMNQMIGSASTSLATMFGRTVNIHSPVTKIYNNPDDLTSHDLGDEGPVVVTSFRMLVGDILDTQIMQVMSMDTAREEASLLLGQLTQFDEKEVLPAGELPEAEKEPGIAELSDECTDSSAQELPETEPDQPVAAAPEPPAARPQVHATFATEKPPTAVKQVTAPSGINQQRLDLILDIPLKVTVLLGRTRWPIKDILELTPGSVVELQNLVDEPVEVLINGILVAKGEVVVVNENFGVRLTSIIGPEERLQNLKM